MTMATKYQLSLPILLLLLTAAICPAAEASRSLMGAASVGTTAVSSQGSGKRTFNDEKPFFKGTSTFFNPPRIPPSSYASKAANNVFKDEKPFFKGSSTFFNPPRIPPNSYASKTAKSVFKDKEAFYKETSTFINPPHIPLDSCASKAC